MARTCCSYHTVPGSGPLRSFAARHAGHPLPVPPHLHKLGAVDPAFLAQHRLQRQLDGEVGDPQLRALDRNLQ